MSKLTQKVFQWYGIAGYCMALTHDDLNESDNRKSHVRG